MPNDIEIRQKWIKALSLTTDDLSKKIFVCSDHFGPEDYRYEDGNRLKTTSVPHKNLEYKKSAPSNPCSVNYRNFPLNFWKGVLKESNCLNDDTATK